MERALVLGGGGVTGVAWEIGLLAGFAQAGLSLGDADLVVGTSAGSVVAVHVASGADPAASFARQVEARGHELTARIGIGVIARLALAAMTRSPTEFGKRMGRLALRATTVSEAERREVIVSRLPTADWPARDLRITAVDTASGELRVFTRSDSVPLGDAVAASCAVPGVWPPVTIQGRRYMDGGMRSAANAHLAGGAARVVVLAPIAVGFGAMPSVARQVVELRRGGSQVIALSPNAESRRAIGRNTLDPARRAPAARAGYAQAAEEVAAVRALWQGGVKAPPPRSP